MVAGASRSSRPSRTSSPIKIATRPFVQEKITDGAHAARDEERAAARPNAFHELNVAVETEHEALDFEIGRFPHLKSEIRKFRLD